MKKNVSRPSREIGTRIAVPVLFAVLCVLTFFTVTSIGGISRTSERSFDFDGLTNEARREEADVSD